MRAAIVGGLLLCAGCGGGTVTADSSDGGAADALSSEGADGGSCTWPASLDPTDASTGQCAAARSYLSCQGSNGVTELCLSNDPTQCPGPNLQPGVSFTCSDRCNTSEYGVECGFGPGPAPQAASNCRSMGITPGGTGFYCCPCGEGAADAATDAGTNLRSDAATVDAPAEAMIAPADAYVAATVAAGDGGTCNVSSATVIVDIGEAAAASKPATIANGGSEPGGPSVSVSCSVIASGSGFNVQLSAGTLGPGGGSFSVTSLPGQPLDPKIGGKVLTTWTNPSVGSYSEPENGPDCTLTYSYQGGPIPTSPPIAAGRIWAHVSCPMATDPDTEPLFFCDGEADFLFENCVGE